MQQKIDSYFLLVWKHGCPQKYVKEGINEMGHIVPASCGPGMFSVLRWYTYVLCAGILAYITYLCSIYIWAPVNYSACHLWTLQQPSCLEMCGGNYNM